ncbi:MAG: hypothetical protein QOE83_1084, partial [Actinomycetota bacterium]|nr:hypothetical protein [Actinomycetota bacterium]
PQAGATASHTYNAAGTFTVTVTVKDTANLTSTATKTVSVSGTTSPNLIGNPGFETSMSGWNASGRAGVTFSQSSTARSGTFSAVITNTNSTTVPECTLNDSPNWVKSTVPGTYQISLWVRADTPGATLKLKIREYTSSGAAVTSGSSTVTLSATWQQVKFPYVVSASGNNLDFNALTLNSAPGTCFYADDASITGPP